jgi:hypothetical protein
MRGAAFISGVKDAIVVDIGTKNCNKKIHKNF